MTEKTAEPKISIIERKIPFFLISRQLMRGNKWTLALVIFLMSVAFINLVFINSLFNGIVEASNDQIIATTSGNITLSPPAGTDLLSGAAAILKKVESIKGVKAASVHTLVPASLARGNITGTYQVTAVDPAQEAKTTNIKKKIVSGKYLSPGDTNGIVIGRQVAGGKDVEMNSTSLKGARVGQKVILNMGGLQRELVIRGIFYTKYFEADRTAFINAKTLDQMAPQMTDQASSIIIVTGNKGGEAPVIQRLKAAGIKGDFMTWREASGLMKSVTSSFVTINALLTTVGFIIAAVVIFIIIYVDISNKRRQIGILRAIGIKSYLVSSTYILQSTIYSMVGVLFGALIFFFAIIPYFKVHPFKIPLGDVSLYVDYIDFTWRAITVIVVAILSGMIPAILATRRPILDEIAGR